jgi:hypothetical protein
MSDGLSMPFKGAHGEALRIEFHELAALRVTFDSIMNCRLVALQKLLASDPESVVRIVRCAATGTNDLVGTVRARNEVWRLFALPANDTKIGHN